jgi:ubiquinone/menaquinone biosynthesis C-methylase UbiE
MNERTYNNTISRLRSTERTERLEVPRVAEICLKDMDITSVLDIGTGSGLFAEEFKNNSIRVSGIDVNPEMIEEAKKYIPGFEVKLAPAEKIPFEDKSFDMTFMGLVFHEVDDYRKTLLETARVSKKVTAILEWDYVIQEFGPPLEHRLKREFVEKSAIDAGYKKVEVFPLKFLVLYKLYL